MKNGNRILSVKIRTLQDGDSDTSYLGEYGSKGKTDYAIDRAHSVDCIENNFPLREKLGRVVSHLEGDQTYCEAHDYFDHDCAECIEQVAIETAIREVQDLATCDCGRGDWNRREYRYYNGPVENYLGESPEDIHTYIRQDYARMEGLNDGQWWYVGIRAEAEIRVVYMTEGKGGRDYYQTQTITSGALYGIESDSGKEYIKENQDQQLQELKGLLTGLGFSKRAISTAFKSVEEVQE